MTSRRADIDGLRTVAIISVLLFHAKYSVFKGGFVGVDVFFVISGFVITQTILRNIQDDRFSLLDFYARRARRLLPALAIVLVATLAAGWFVLWPIHYRKLAEQAIAGTLFAPNFLFWSEAGYFDSSADLKPLLHLWSLGVEEQFYLVWPIIIFKLARHRRALLTFLTAATIASFLFCVYLTRFDSTAAFYSPLTRFWELSVGGLIAIVGIRPIPTHVRSAIFVGGLSAIGYAVLMFHAGGRFPGYQAALPTLGTAAIIYTGVDNPIARYTLSLRPVVYIGLISYPLYLWHWPILSLARHAGLGQYTLTLLGLSFVLAIATYELVERRTQQLAPAAIWKPLWACMATISAASLAIIASGGLYMRYPDQVVPVLRMAEYDYGKDARLHTCWHEPGKDRPVYPPECTSPKQPGAILLFGDSHAGRLYPGLKLAFADRPIWQVTQSSCMAAVTSSECVAAMEHALRTASKKAPQYVVLFAAWPNYTTDWDEMSQQSNALSSAIEKFKRTGAQVIVMGPAPIWRPSLLPVAYNLAIKTGSIPLRDKAVSPAVGAIDKQIRLVAEHHGAKFFSVNDALCNSDGCLVHVPGNSGEFTTWDYGHLTTAGAEYVARELAKDLNISHSASASPD